MNIVIITTITTATTLFTNWNMYRFGCEVEPDFDAIDFLMSKPSTGHVEFIGDGVVIDGKSCFHRAPTPHRYTVTFCSYVEEIKSRISYANIEDDLNGNTDDVNEPNTEDRDQRNEFSIHSTQDDDDIHKSNKFLKKQNSIDIIRNSNIPRKEFSTNDAQIDNEIHKPNKFKKQNSIEILRNSKLRKYAHSNSYQSIDECSEDMPLNVDKKPRKEFSTNIPEISSEINKSNRNFKKQNSVEILRNPGVKRYAYSHNYKSMDEFSDDEYPDDDHPKEYVNKKEVRRGSLASAVSRSFDEVRRGSLASTVVDGASTVGAGCFTVLVAHLFMKKFV